MKNRKLKISDIIFIVFIALLLIPQTRTPIQVALNKLKVAVWSPSISAMEDQDQVTPFKYAVQDLNGVSKTIPIGQGKVTFLSYWATWCPPCIAEMPGIQELYIDYGETINFVLLTQEEAEKAQRFMTKSGYDLPVYIPQMQAPEILQENSLPTNYIIDAQGTIIIKETGAADWNSGKVRKLLDGLLSK
ncbi:TlpA family protein disulfide reductase [Maribacter sp. ACAM166]|uniref:TlpA family protein disulfide reductase n=1 Tax=Maribacter sp. ACAM166 TaxID=2508996 RepID=UPI0010FCEEB4|nr:TlpA disulfide reductase family protein [Maribacter sp. ACAM166]TLP75705.1 TlpA family protein disulfide reductase [Maribacter sp. ACAM166]